MRPPDVLARLPRDLEKHFKNLKGNSVVTGFRNYLMLFFSWNHLNYLAASLLSAASNALLIISLVQPLIKFFYQTCCF